MSEHSTRTHRCRDDASISLLAQRLIVVGGIMVAVITQKGD